MISFIFWYFHKIHFTILNLIEIRSDGKLLIFKQSVFRIYRMLLLIFLLEHLDFFLLWGHDQIIPIFFIILWVMEARTSCAFWSLWSLMNFLMLKVPSLLFFSSFSLSKLYNDNLVSNFPRTTGSYKLLFLLFSVCFALWIFGAVDTLYSSLR